MFYIHSIAKTHSKTTDLMTDELLREKLGKNLHRLARPNAGRDMAATILNVARKSR